MTELLQSGNTLLIVMQDNPDPDAIASAAALKVLANAVASVQCSIAHGGIVGRAENQAMVKYLDLNLRPVTEMDADRFDLVALVDTQPQTGNNSLPRDIIPDIVIDHHPIRAATRSAPYTDIRSRYGATSTILHEYLAAAKVPVDVPLATSLLYGIRSDTQDFGREATQADIDAFLALYPAANKRMLGRIQWGRVPDAYFKLLFVALGNAIVYGDCVATSLGVIDNPDIVGEVADLLLRRQDTSWVLCYGFYMDMALFSLRASESNAAAGSAARKIAGRKGSGGGHNAFSAGRIPLLKNTEAERRRLGEVIEARFLKAVGKIQSQAVRLIG
ncbi:MAG: bifunctional oligoribonuclease/PAP phosphatase NrnA [Kiritimatiellia bacterium]